MAWAHAQEEAFNSQERILEGLMFHLDLKGAKEKAGRGAVRGEMERYCFLNREDSL